MTELSQEELEAAANEAGITPSELRNELALHSSSGRAPTTLPAPQRGQSIATMEATMPMACEPAVRKVRELIEKQRGISGHMHGKDQADVLDAEAGLCYRIQAEADGEQRSLVRVDLDPTAGKAGRTFRLASSVALVATSLLLSMWYTPFLGLAALAAVGGVLWTQLKGKKNQAALAQAAEIAQAALFEAESSAIAALRAGSEDRHD